MTLGNIRLNATLTKKHQMETLGNDDDSGKVGKVRHCGVVKILLFEDAFYIFTLNITYSCVASLCHMWIMQFINCNIIKSMTYLHP